MGVFRKGQMPQGLVDFMVWGQSGSPGFPVMGESFHMEDIRRAFLAVGGVQNGDEVFTTAELRPDPTNKYDANAVEVRTPEGLMGFIPRDVAGGYAPVLSAIRASGYRPVTAARIWISEDGRIASVSINLPAPSLLVPINSPPSAAHVVLPRGRVMQVTGEDDHLDTLRPYVRPDGQAAAYVTLHEVQEVGSRSSKTIVEVRIDGRPVGKLSPKLGSDMVPALRYLVERGHLAAAEASIEGNAIKIEVAVFSARAHELTDEWLMSVPDLVSREGAVAQANMSDQVANAVSLISPPPDPATIVYPADWYPDPHGEARLRWWNGSTWTEHVAQ